MVLHRGGCHCGLVRYEVEAPAALDVELCNCSICSRKGAMMSPQAIPVAALKIEAQAEDLGLYQFDSKVAKHYFCRRCGIYTHNEMASKPGYCRVNLGCIEDLDTSAFEVTVFDGKNLL